MLEILIYDILIVIVFGSYAQRVFYGFVFETLFKGRQTKCKKWWSQAQLIWKHWNMAPFIILNVSRYYAILGLYLIVYFIFNSYHSLESEEL